jgi:hypothetical protein
MDDAILREAAAIPLLALRPPDAIHLATAFSVRDDLAGFASYDCRLDAAALRLKFRSFTPEEQSDLRTPYRLPSEYGARPPRDAPPPILGLGAGRFSKKVAPRPVVAVPASPGKV